ncbi:hypothetical protein [Paenibacillus oceani]|uniref:Uncharacterized protein n=1 Tax=Paenibacillus oceani TaxID=2772510 RepID=A0A927H3Z8_9BACL|nr:hypothetical protein [Paenibacillus oceani]MBD2866837.1 hypothetical protein [Paenibacillus oceani]
MKQLHENESREEEGGSANEKSVSQSLISRRKMMAGFGLAGMAVASAGLLGSNMIRADTPLQESVYGSHKNDACTDSIAELRKMDGSSCKTVLVRGYYAANDGGGGLFYWDNGSTAPENGGTVIIPIGKRERGRWMRSY